MQQHIFSLVDKKEKNKNRIDFFYLFFFSFCFLSYSQENTVSKSYHSLDPIEIAKLRNYDFQENFAVLFRSDISNNYFFLDLSKLPSPFAFKYFLFLANQSGNRIQSGHGISDNRAWFITENKNSARESLRLILSLKQSAVDENNILSETEKEDWIKLNNY